MLFKGLNKYSGFISTIIALFSVLATIYFACLTVSLTKQSNRINKQSNEINQLELEQTKITDPLVLKVATNREPKEEISFVKDTGETFNANVSEPAIFTENGNISNIYLFVPDKNNDIITRTIENSEMINSKKIRNVVLNSNNYRTYGLNQLAIHNDLAFYIILAKGFNNDWTSYIVTYKFYDNYTHYHFGVNQANVLTSTNGYMDLSKDDINTIKAFYTKVTNQLKEINFIN